MVEEFGVAKRTWIIDIYEKRYIWTTVYIRGKFFIGFRTSSQCEGLHSIIAKHILATTYIRGKFFAGFRKSFRCNILHSIIAKYVRSQYNLIDFIKHFKQYLIYLRYNEFEADYVFIYSLSLLKTTLKPLEKFASYINSTNIYRKDFTLL
ncbi:hypothetical protein Ahy_B03g061932 isoform B [Arachis hypogaea]|uniref:Protein FAR1-RELATED SEQUENCE n=1 Tax=Arachis hypogaea TaxID=3818 RepID=A0A444ZSK8_ARAHY|nr:hypothetical protein Ahy_B03g061932 isoform B [Arachis hypogaea]